MQTEANIICAQAMVQLLSCSLPTPTIMCGNDDADAVLMRLEYPTPVQAMVVTIINTQPKYRA